MGTDRSAEELRQSVRNYRDAGTTDADREEIRQEWRADGIPNQFAALLRAADLSGDTR